MSETKIEMLRESLMMYFTILLFYASDEGNTLIKQ